MPSRRSTRLIVTYVLSLVVTIGLLVLWVIYVLLSASTITELAQRAGSTSDTPYWSVLWSGVVLFMLVIGGLTFQLALALGARNYSSVFQPIGYGLGMVLPVVSPTAFGSEKRRPDDHFGNVEHVGELNSFNPAEIKSPDFWNHHGG